MKRFTIALFLFAQTMFSQSASAGGILGDGMLSEMVPPQQGPQRKEKSLTVGLPLSVPFNLPSQLQYRLNEKWLIGGGLTVESEGKDEQDWTWAAAHRHSSRTESSTAYIEYYVSGNSGFHIGLGVEARRGTFQEHGPDGNGGMMETASGQFQGVFAGPSFGWTWIWENGITFGFDISKRKRMEHSFHLESIPGRASPDIEKKAFEKHLPETVPGMFMLGYSF